MVPAEARQELSRVINAIVSYVLRPFTTTPMLYVYDKIIYTRDWEKQVPIGVQGIRCSFATLSSDPIKWAICNDHLVTHVFGRIRISYQRRISQHVCHPSIQKIRQQPHGVPFVAPCPSPPALSRSSTFYLCTKTSVAVSCRGWRMCPSMTGPNLCNHSARAWKQVE